MGRDERVDRAPVAEWTGLRWFCPRAAVCAEELERGRYGRALRLQASEKRVEPRASGERRRRLSDLFVTWVAGKGTFEVVRDRRRRGERGTHVRRDTRRALHDGELPGGVRHEDDMRDHGVEARQDG